MDQGKTGRFIAEKRKEKGMTQKELAKQLGIGDKAISKWECGRGMPDNSLMLPLCDILGIKVNELLLGESLPENSYHESSEDIILTLVEEKEYLKKFDLRGFDSPSFFAYGQRGEKNSSERSQVQWELNTRYVSTLQNPAAHLLR